MEEEPGPLYYQPKYKEVERKVKGCTFGSSRVTKKETDDRDVLYPKTDIMKRNKGTAVMRPSTK